MTTQGQSLPTRHALIVEDEALLLDSFAMSLRRVGWLRISKARCAEDALQLAASDPPDIVLTDVRMPGMGGLELLDRIREILPNIPVVVMTAYGVHLQNQAMRRGATCFLEKPFRLSELRSMLQMLCTKHETVVPPPNGEIAFEGRLESLSLPDVIQVACIARQNGRIEVRRKDGRLGTVWVRDGDILDAHVENETGLDAFFALSTYNEGSFCVTRSDQDVPRCIFVPWQELLMESARRYDESQNQPADESLFRLSRPPPALQFTSSRFPPAPHVPMTMSPHSTVASLSVQVFSPRLGAMSMAPRSLPGPERERGQWDSFGSHDSVAPEKNTPPASVPAASVPAASVPAASVPAASVPAASVAVEHETITQPEKLPGDSFFSELAVSSAPMAFEAETITEAEVEKLQGDSFFSALQQNVASFDALLSPMDATAPSSTHDQTPARENIPLASADDALRETAEAMGKGAYGQARSILEFALAQWPEDRRLRANLSRLERKQRP